MITVSQSSLDPAFVQAPYGFYRSVRAQGDFVFWQEYGIACATTSSAVNAVLRHPKLGRATPEDKRRPTPPHLCPFYDIEAHSMLELEGPRHTRLRNSVLSAFTRSSVNALAPSISMTADDLIDIFPDGPFDLLDAYARPLPVRIIADVLGIPREMAPRLLDWSNAMVAMYQARRDDRIELAAAAASSEFSEYVASVLAKRRTQPGDDLLSRLADASVDGTHLTTEEIVSTAILLLNAGHEATVHSIGNAVRALCGYPERKLALDPKHIAGTVDECLRFDPPLHMFRRWVYEDVSILGEHFTAGQEIGCLLGSACHDDAVWPDGEVFDPFRARRTNVAFGAGIHFCLGAQLARLELQIALPALFSGCPDIDIVEKPVVADLYHFRGLERLTVTC